MIVVDASAILELLLQSRISIRIEERLLREHAPIHAPALIDLEVAHTLRRYVGRSEMTVDRARASLDLLSEFPITRHLHEPLIERVWELRENLTAYDAAYVALAEGMGATLITCDARLANAPGIRAAVEVFR